mgnify:CR=1 FL=1
MGYLGRIPAGGRFAKLDDISSGFNGSANTFTLSIGSDQPNIASINLTIICCWCSSRTWNRLWSKTN